MQNRQGVARVKQVLVVDDLNLPDFYAGLLV